MNWFEVYWFFLQFGKSYWATLTSGQIMGLFAALLTVLVIITVMVMSVLKMVKWMLFRWKVRKMTPEQKKRAVDELMEDAITTAITEASVKGLLNNQEAEAQYRRAADRLGLVGLLPKAYDGARTWQMVEALKRILKARIKKEKETSPPKPIQPERKPRSRMEAL